MLSKTGGIWRYLGGGAVIAVLLVLIGTGEVSPFTEIRGIVPPGLRDYVTLGGLVVLALVVLVSSLVVVLRVTVFLLSVVFRGREALDRLPDVDPLVGGAVGITLVAAIVMGGATVMGGDAGDTNIGYVDEAFSGDPENPHGIVADDELEGLAYANESLPEYEDTDRDRLPDAWERAGETPDGVPLPDADPDRKDVYVQVNYASGTEPLSDSERRQLRRIWSGMPVSNPDGATGIRIHLVDEQPRGGPIPDEVSVGSGGFDSEFLETYYSPDYMGPRTCSHYLVLFGEVTGPYTGWGLTPGYLSVVDGTERAPRANTSARVTTLTHELLHNLVGTTSEGRSHVSRGWLAGRNGEFEPSMSDAVSRDLNRSGFERSHGIELALCDEPVGATGAGSDD